MEHNLRYILILFIIFAISSITACVSTGPNFDGHRLSSSGVKSSTFDSESQSKQSKKAERKNAKVGFYRGEPKVPNRWTNPNSNPENVKTLRENIRSSDLETFKRKHRSFPVTDPSRNGQW